MPLLSPHHNYLREFHVYRNFNGSISTDSGSTASTTAYGCSPRLSRSHVLARTGSSSIAPVLSVRIFTCGRNGSVGCSAVTTASSSPLSRRSEERRVGEEC